MNIGTLMYLEYLSKHNQEKLVKDYVCILPNEIFEHHIVKIDHFDRDEHKDYSFGFKRIVTERYYTYSEDKEYFVINSDNFRRWLEINHKIFRDKLNITYNKYLKSIGKYVKEIKREKIDNYDEIEYEKKTIYKFIYPI